MANLKNKYCPGCERFCPLSSPLCDTGRKNASLLQEAEAKKAAESDRQKKQAPKADEQA